MAERKDIIIILTIIVIALSVIVVAFGSEEIIKAFFVSLIFLLVFIFLPIFLILNGRRYIKNGEWYFNPFIAWASDPSEETKNLSAWIQLIMGIIVLIAVVGGSLIVILMTVL